MTRDRSKALSLCHTASAGVGAEPRSKVEDNEAKAPVERTRIVFKAVLSVRGISITVRIILNSKHVFITLKYLIIK